MHNHGVEQALDWGADAICFLDPDQIHPEDMLQSLVSRLEGGCDVVGALVPLRMFVPQNGMKPFQSMAWVKEKDGTLRRIREADGDLQRVHSTGTGVLMIKASLVDRLRRPWFIERVDEDSFDRFGGSDTRFVGRLRDELGALIYVDTTIKVEHLKIFRIDETFSDRFSDYTNHDIRKTGDWERENSAANGFGGWSIDKACYRKIREMLPDGSTILELGSGAVTNKLKRHYTVVSIEEDPKRVNGGGIHYAPIKDGWYSTDGVKSALPEAYDMILVDGPVTNGVVSRMGFVDNRDLFDLCVPIVFDDVNRPDDDLAMQLIARITGKKPEVFRGHDKDFAVLA